MFAHTRLQVIVWCQGMLHALCSGADEEKCLKRWECLESTGMLLCRFSLEFPFFSNKNKMAMTPVPTYALISFFGAPVFVTSLNLVVLDACRGFSVLSHLIEEIETNGFKFTFCRLSTVDLVYPFFVRTQISGLVRFIQQYGRFSLGRYTCK